MSLLLQILIFLGASLIIVPLTKKLGVPTVLGYLITGIVLGPSILNLAHDSVAIMQLANFGVIFLMFLIGLELRPQRLWQLRHAIFLMGSLQVCITGSLFYFILWLIFQQSIAASFALGFALALSSTSFVLQLLTEKQKLNTTYGQHSFSILLFQDIAAIPLLAIIPLLAGTSSAHHGIAYFAAIIATFSGLFLFSRFVMRPFFRFVAQSGATELLTAVALFIVLGVVLLMDTLAISTTLGAFLTGVLLADSEFRHELEASIAPFKGLLLGLFFMTVGMMTQLSVLFDHPIIILASALALLILKMTTLTAIARHYKYSWKNSILIGGVLAQGGEFAFVIFNVAYSEKIISHAILEPVTLIVTLSMLMTPCLFWFLNQYIVPRLEQENKPAVTEPPSDITPHPSMIIAGFGRVGQIIARIAHLKNISFTAIDLNLKHIDFIKKYGGTLYYGDVTQPNLLRSAGIEHSKILVLAIDDVEDALNTARHVLLHYPHITILARARDRHHVHLLKDLGVHYIWRETYLSSLSIAHRALCILGIDDDEALQQIDTFRDEDEKLLALQQQYLTEENKVFETYPDALAELEQLFENDKKYLSFTDSSNTEQRISITRNQEK